MIKKNKSNSIILNYDEKASDLFYWYQQLVAESLSKKSKGILPIISKMPQDNHSLMQFYLDGGKCGNKYLINEKGLLEKVISPRTSPEDEKIINWIIN